MKIHRFYVPRLPDGILTDERVAHQVRHVLRLKAGERVALFDIQGNEVVYTLEGFEGVDGLALHFEEKAPSIELKQEIILCVAMLKKDNFETVLQKATEIGVSRIQPLLTERTVKLGWKKERFHTILLEAAEQAGRQKIPILAEPMSLGDVFQSHQKTPKYFFDLGAPLLSTKDIFENGDTVACFVGPEGGWSESERALAREAGCVFAGLGSFTYRAETAALATLALCAHRALTKK